jgi:WD40 repeat protein/AraC-like DNA-binding protein
MSLAFSPDQRLLASGSADQTVRCFEWQTGRQVSNLIDHNKTVTKVAFHPDGDRLASAGEDGVTRLWALRGAPGDPLLAELRGHASTLQALSFSADGTKLATGAMDGTVKVWDVDASAASWEVRGLRFFWSAAALSPQGRQVALLRDGAVEVWDLDRAQLVAQHRGAFRQAYYHDRTPLAFDAQGEWIAFSPTPGGVQLWHPESDESRSLPRSIATAVTDLAFHPDGSMLAVGSLTQIPLIYEVETGDLIPCPLMPGGSLREYLGLYGLSWSSEDHVLALCLNDLLVVVDVDLELIVAALRHPAIVRSASFLPDGRVVTGADDGKVRLWDPETGKLVAELGSHGRVVRSLAVSPDGSRIVTGSDRETVRVFDVSSHQPVLSLRGFDHSSYDLGFSSDGRRLLTLSLAHSIRVFETEGVAERGERIREQGRLHARVRTRVEELFQERILMERVLRILEVDDSLTRDFREAALAYARARGDDPIEMEAAARRLLWSGDEASETYERELRRIELARDLARGKPHDHRLFRETLGLAQFRTGSHPQAIATFSRLFAEQGDSERGMRALALMALVYWTQGHQEKARRALLQVRGRIQELDREAFDRDTKLILSIADSLVTAPQ